jgi:hypothetical protein
MKFHLARLKLRPAHWAMIISVVLAAIYWGNLFRFHPLMIDRVYDSTSEQVVMGRMARSAADGLTSENADLGVNYFPSRDRSEDYETQRRFYDHPELIHTERPDWGPYPSQFGLQGIIFSMLDLVNPLPRKFRVGFYHLLAALFAASMLVWIAEILRRRFGWPAFFGFLIPPMLEPMFSALAPNLYWLVGLWYVPMAIALLLADEDEPKRRTRLIALAFLFFLAKFLCGYEFTPTVILAAAAGCMLGVREIPDRPPRMLRDIAWIVGGGVAGFVVAAFAHAARQGGFAVIAQKAANRMTGDASSLQDELIFGKFASISSVLSTYLGSNFVALIKSFGLVLALLAIAAIVSLLDGRLNWYLGPDRRKLQILALGFLASIAAPLSWFVLGKAHSFVHPPIDLILWYLPTIPLGGAMVGVALAQTVEHRALWRADWARSVITALVPALTLSVALFVYFADRTIETQGTWVIRSHADATPIFKSDELGVDFRMNDQWFIIQYRCGIVSSGETFFIRIDQGNAVANYDFRLGDRQVFARKGECFSAEPKTDRRFSKIHYGQMSGQKVVWERATQLSFPDSFTPEQFTNVDWDRGISRPAGTELLVSSENFAGLFIAVGDHLELSPSDRHTVKRISSFGVGTVIFLDGPPIRLAEGIVPRFKIVRQ